MNGKMRLFFIVMTVLICNGARAQKSNTVDSLTISKIVVDFFEWYLTEIKNHRYSEFQPSIIEGANGMTTLYMDNYLENLIKNGFSDSLILREKLSYLPCDVNLKRIRFNDFKANFSDLDDIENIDCDFGNYYRWIGGQEAPNGIRIKNIKHINSVTVEVVIDYFDESEEMNKAFFWGNNSVFLRRIGGIWKIDNISSH